MPSPKIILLLYHLSTAGQEIGSTESPIQLSHLEFVVFVYRNAAAVYMESDFINNSEGSLTQELSLPSTGHDENGQEFGGRISNGILGIQLWIEDERVAPEFVQDGNEQWYTIQTEFPPHENRKVKALFWAETSLIDVDSIPGLDTTIIIEGQRGFLINLAHASVWNNVIHSINTYIVLNDGISVNPDLLKAEPASFELNNSTLIWSMNEIEPSEDNNIELKYESGNSSNTSLNTMGKLSSFIIKEAYDQLLNYANQLNEE